MIKPTDGLAGTDVKKMKVSEVGDIEKFYEYIKENNMFLEDYVYKMKIGLKFVRLV